jgi:protein SCO1/2
MTIATLCFCCQPAAAQAANSSRTNHQERTLSDGSVAQLVGTTQDQSPARRYFTDVLLINQNGEKMRLYTDLLQGKVVVINSFFGTCQGSCLPVNHRLEQVQDAMGEHMAKDLRIISITVDPSVDTPARLKKYAEELHAKPGRYFLTGEKENVDLVLSKLGQYVDDKQNHSNVIIIGNEHTGLWKKAFGLSDSKELVKIVESVLNDRISSDK